jgi:hypothetical protein
MVATFMHEVRGLMEWWAGVEGILTMASCALVAFFVVVGIITMFKKWIASSMFILLLVIAAVAAYRL